MIRWLINKLTMRQVFELEQKVSQLSDKYDRLLEKFRQLRAYVGYYGAKKDFLKNNPQSKKEVITKEMMGFIATLPPWQQESLLGGLPNERDGDSSNSETWGDIGAESDTETGGENSADSEES